MKTRQRWKCPSQTDRKAKRRPLLQAPSLLRLKMTVEVATTVHEAKDNAELLVPMVGARSLEIDARTVVRDATGLMDLHLDRDVTARDRDALGMMGLGAVVVVVVHEVTEKVLHEVIEEMTAGKAIDLLVVVVAEEAHLLKTEVMIEGNLIAIDPTAEVKIEGNLIAIDPTAGVKIGENLIAIDPPAEVKIEENLIAIDPPAVEVEESEVHWKSEGTIGEASEEDVIVIVENLVSEEQ
jgi:hypothetical protein